MDRDSQFAPIIALLPQLLALRKTADNATAALAANSAAVTKLTNLFLAAKQKADPFAGPQAADFLAYGNAWNALTTEQAKTAALQAAATNAVLAYRNSWMQGNADYNSLLQDPGLQEIV